MDAKRWIFAIVVALSLAMGCPAGFAQEQKQAKPWTGRLADGTVIHADDLTRTLAEHRKWLRGEAGGKQAELQRAKLSGADLEGAGLARANLQGARLEEANLEEAVLNRANLKEAVLIKANLKGAVLIKANLKGAGMDEANLQGAEYNWQSLQGAGLIKASLQGAGLNEAKLEGARLNEAKLEGARLNEAKLEGAELIKANLQGAIFEIEPNTLPEIRSTGTAVNLAFLRYKESPHALIELREAFKKYGLRQQEREITYAIKHSGYLNAMAGKDIETKFQVIAGRLLFDLPCQWGMAPMRPLIILLIGIAFFSPVYILAIKKRKKYLSANGYAVKKESKTDGIWKTWIPERARRDLGGNAPELLACGWWGAIGIGIYFSVLSAFQVGWKDLNVGSWIARMQPREYRLHASGWMRFVSGLQSLISVYLLALCVLSYFGRPFEGY
ncbi:pentapeptide repeat-containing protein [Desulfosarcina cetonica]|uniref:pentapeptide repeat-containing protein n=1 Tax=Desulfosarcina cetonica TaxID=90730 RepID=UPI0006D234C0|nr:pentapeptide repeat-containing protein [Desulfosarcina cetonica]